MRLATWNCCGGFDSKLPHLLALDVDVAVVCEARTPAHWPTLPDGRRVTGLGRQVQPGHWKELAVLAREPWTVALHEQAEAAPVWTLPVRVTGPTSFTLVGLWPVKFDGAPRSYEAQVEAAVDWLERCSAGEPTVLAGDFNSPLAGTQQRYDRIAQRLDDLGLVDAYRVSRGLVTGEPPVEPTYFNLRKEDPPFHIDHVFVRAEWAGAAKVDVGDFDTWTGSGCSDHVPVTVEVS